MCLIVGRVFRLKGEEGTPLRAYFLQVVGQTLIKLASMGVPVALEMSEQYDSRQWRDFLYQNVPPGVTCYWVNNVLRIFPPGYVPKT
jgi:hypothetical protein